MTVSKIITPGRVTHVLGDLPRELKRGWSCAGGGDVDRSEVREPIFFLLAIER